MNNTVLVSWSGERSKSIAAALHEWLPLVVRLKPWTSAASIPAGTVWADELLRSFQTAMGGIVCVTPENRNSPWLHFEAGMLLNGLERRRVYVYLYDMAPTELQYPLTMFQHSMADECGTRELISSLNGAAPPELQHTEAQLHRAYALLWPDLAQKLKCIPGVTKPDKRPERDLLEEVLTILRSNVYARGPADAGPPRDAFRVDPELATIQIRSLLGALRERMKTDKDSAVPAQIEQLERQLKALGEKDAR